MLVQKKISDREYREWAKEYDQAKSSINNRDEKIAAVVAKIEKDFYLVGATAIEDEL